MNTVLCSDIMGVNFYKDIYIKNYADVIKPSVVIAHKEKNDANLALTALQKYQNVEPPKLEDASTSSTTNEREYGTETASTTANKTESGTETANETESGSETAKLSVGSNLEENDRKSFRSNLDDNDYKCPTCDLNLLSLTKLTIHYQTHSGERLFYCDLCNRYFSSANSNWHRISAHKRMNEQDYKKHYIAKGLKRAQRKMLAFLLEWRGLHVGESDFRTLVSRLESNDTDSSDSVINDLVSDVDSDKHLVKRDKIDLMSDNKANLDKNLSTTKSKRTMINEYSALNSLKFICPICSIHYESWKSLTSHYYKHFEGIVFCRLCDLVYRKLEPITHMNHGHPSYNSDQWPKFINSSDPHISRKLLLQMASTQINMKFTNKIIDDYLELKRTNRSSESPTTTKGQRSTSVSVASSTENLRNLTEKTAVSTNCEENVSLKKSFKNSLSLAQGEKKSAATVKGEKRSLECASESEKKRLPSSIQSENRHLPSSSTEGWAPLSSPAAPGEKKLSLSSLHKSKSKENTTNSMRSFRHQKTGTKRSLSPSPVRVKKEKTETRKIENVEMESSFANQVKPSEKSSATPENSTVTSGSISATSENVTIEHNDRVVKTGVKTERKANRGNRLKANFICPVCFLSFSTTSLLQKHKIEKHPIEDRQIKQLHEILGSNGVFQCPKCTFNVKYNNYKHHIILHMHDHNNDSFTCPYCQHKTNSARTVYYHVKSCSLNPYSSSRNRWFTCTICQTSYKTSDALESHKINDCGLMQNIKQLRCIFYRKEIGSYICFCCGFNKKAKTEFDDHMARHRNKWRCYLCQEAFTSFTQLAQHAAIHVAQVSALDLSNSAQSSESNTSNSSQLSTASTSNPSQFCAPNTSNVDKITTPNTSNSGQPSAPIVSNSRSFSNALQSLPLSTTSQVSNSNQKSLPLSPKTKSLRNLSPQKSGLKQHSTRLVQKQSKQLVPQQNTQSVQQNTELKQKSTQLLQKQSTQLAKKRTTQLFQKQNTQVQKQSTQLAKKQSTQLAKKRITQLVQKQSTQVQKQSTQLLQSSSREPSPIELLSEEDESSSSESDEPKFSFYHYECIKCNRRLSSKQFLINHYKLNHFYDS